MPSEPANGLTMPPSPKILSIVNKNVECLALSKLIKISPAILAARASMHIRLILV